MDKLKEYAAFGIRCYVLVDPWARILHAYALAASGRYELSAAASDGSVAIPGCEGLTLDLDAMWRYVDEHVGEDEAEG